MIKFKISLSLIFCLVLFAFSEFTFGQSDSLEQLFRSYQQFIENTPTLNYAANSEKNQNQHNSDSGIINSSRSFIYFFNDSIVYGNKIVLKTPFLSRNKFVIDNKVYLANKVKFYNKNDSLEASIYKGLLEKYLDTLDIEKLSRYGDINEIKQLLEAIANEKWSFYANMNKEGRAPRFIKREISGKINYYKDEYYSPGYYMSGYSTPGFYSGGRYYHGLYQRSISMPPQHGLIQYYNFGYGDIKKATYKNLLKDIGQNQNSKYYLDMCKRKNRNKEQHLEEAIRAYNE